MMDRNFDASKLPEHAFGYHSLTWWGTAGYIAVEGAFFAVLVATYLYGMGRVPDWPPGAVEPLPLLWGTVGMVILLVSVVPNMLYKRAALRQDATGSRRWLLVAAVLGVIFLGVRVLEFSVINVKWTDHFYGSIVWLIFGVHTIHFLADFIECVVLALLVFRRPLDVKRFSDLVDDALYWYFVIAVWVVLYVLLYLVPRWV